MIDSRGCHTSLPAGIMNKEWWSEELSATNLFKVWSILLEQLLVGDVELGMEDGMCCVHVFFFCKPEGQYSHAV
jgi:hypothetical protein